MPRGSVLDKLFGSEVKVRLLRLFLLNPSEVFDHETLTGRVRFHLGFIKKELAMLCAIGYIKRGSKTITVEVGHKKKLVRRKVIGFLLNRDFPYLKEIEALLASSVPAARKKLAGGIKSAGKITLLVIAGSALGEERLHVDVFIVGDSLKKSKIENVLKDVESEMGREFVYAFMPTREFEYRYGMHDRFLGDLFSRPHEILINRLKISPLVSP